MIKVGTDVFYAKFAEFIKLHKDNNYSDKYLGDGVRTPLTLVYSSFQRAIQDVVRRV